MKKSQYFKYAQFKTRKNKTKVESTTVKSSNAPVISDHHPIQQQVFLSPHRHKVLVIGRQWGKSVLLREICLKKMWDTPKAVIFLVGPTRELVKDVHWEALKERIMSQLQWKCIINEHDLSIKRLTNGAKIYLKSGEKPDRLRGRTLSLVCLDEVADMDPEVWEQALSPATIINKADVIMAGSPKGHDHLYDLYQKCGIRFDNGETIQNPTGWEDWVGWRLPSVNSPYITEEEVQKKKAVLNAKAFQQEYLAEFITFAGRAYDEFARESNVSESVTMSNLLPIQLCCDFGTSFMGWVLAQSTEEMTTVFDEIIGRDINTVAQLGMLKDRLVQWHGGNLDEAKRHQIICYGDSSGTWTSDPASFTSSWWLIENTLKNEGWNVTMRLTKSNPRVADRVLSMNCRFKSADGKIHMSIHPRCSELIKDFEAISHEDLVAGAKTRSGKDRSHCSDSLGYMVHYDYGLRRRASIAQY